MLVHRSRRPIAALLSVAAGLFTAAVSLAATSEQIIVDQIGWRADAPRKVAIFADPVTGQNSAVAYTPGGTFEVRRASDNATVYTGTVTSWKSGTTHATSGDKVWYGDFSTLTTPGEYYIFDPANNLQSYTFKLDNNVFTNVMRDSVRTFLYQRCGTAISAAHGGNWNHPICHVGTGQDLAARQWLSGAVTGTARDVSGGWHDAGDMNKYVPFTANTVWNLMAAYEWNPGVFPDTWGIPESGNGVPDMLDEIKYELDWLLKMQMADGSVCNRVAVTSYVASSPPNMETIARYYTAPTTWATATAAGHFAYGARLFSAYGSQYPNYSNTLRLAAENAWTYLQAHPTMTPSNGTDNSGGMASVVADGNAGMDLRLRVLAAAQLFKTTGNTAYRTFFDTYVKDPATVDNGGHPLINNWFDPTQATEISRACVVYATTTGATQALVDEIKNDLAGTLNAYYGYYVNGDDAYRAFMWDGHYTWGSNNIKAEWGNLFVYGINLNVSPANTPNYKEAAEEYLHYFHGRNPLSWCYLTNLGGRGTDLGADKCVSQIYHGWFCDGSALYDGNSSTFGAAPGYLAGGPNQYFSVRTIKPPFGEPPMKAYKDWNTAWNGTRNENSWEITEPAIYYQAAYTLLISQFATSSGVATKVVAPTLAPPSGTFAGPVPVEITCATPSASIRYTLDGSTPSSTQGTLYTGPVTLAVGATTLKAVAYKSGMLDSDISSGSYTVLIAVSGLTRKLWLNVGGKSTADVPVGTTPTTTETWTQPLETPQNLAETYGQQFVGYLVPPTTGAYTFWIACADAGDIYLSTTDQPANKVKIAYLRLGSGWRAWTSNNTQKSAPINLVAGQRYYFEVLQKEQNGSDHLSVGWAKPGQSTALPSELLPPTVVLPMNP